MTFNSEYLVLHELLYWPFLQWKDEIANPCNFSAQKEELEKAEREKKNTEKN